MSSISSVTSLAVNSSLAKVSFNSFSTWVEHFELVYSTEWRNLLLAWRANCSLFNGFKKNSLNDQIWLWNVFFFRYPAPPLVHFWWVKKKQDFGNRDRVWEIPRAIYRKFLGSGFLYSWSHAKMSAVFLPSGFEIFKEFSQKSLNSELFQNSGFRDFSPKFGFLSSGYTGNSISRDLEFLLNWVSRQKATSDI